MRELKFYLTDLINDYRDAKKIAKKLASIYRKFPEYSLWSKSKIEEKSNCEMCGLSFVSDYVKPNVHHEPTLTDVIEKVIIEKLENGEEFTTIDILSEIHKLHEEDKIGYMVLCECCHKRLHAKRKKEK